MVKSPDRLATVPPGRRLADSGGRRACRAWRQGRRHPIAVNGLAAGVARRSCNGTESSKTALRPGLCRPCAVADPRPSWPRSRCMNATRRPLRTVGGRCDREHEIRPADMWRSGLPVPALCRASLSRQDIHADHSGRLLVVEKPLRRQKSGEP